MFQYSENSASSGEDSGSRVYVPQSSADARFYVLSMEDESKKESSLLKWLGGFFDSCGSFMWNVFVPALLLSVAGLVVAEFLDPGTIADLHDEFWKAARKH